MTFAPANSKAPFLTTAEVFPEDASQFLVKVTSLHTDIANCVNIREIATYQDNQAILTGQQFSIPGQNQKKAYTFRKTFYFGAIAIGATLNIAHNITGLVQFTHMYGTCITDVVDYRPIPYVDVLAANYIVLKADAVNVTIINGAAANITSGIIVVEYLLQ